MQIDASGYAKLSGDPKVVQCAELASRYKKDVINLTRLCKTLQTAPPSSFVNLFDVFQSHEIYDRIRIDSYASDQITKAVASFVGRGIYDELQACASSKRSSLKHVQHKIAGCKFQQDVSNYITRATVDTATRGTDEHARMFIKDALLAQLFVVWSSVCVPLIETERKSTQDEATRCSSLVAAIKKAVKRFNEIEHGESLSEERAYRSFLKSVCMSHHHTIARIRVDDWFVSSKSIWPADSVCSAATIVSWIQKDGQRFRNALSQDCNRLQRLCKEPPDSSAWHGIEVVHTVDDPMNAFRFQPPSYVGRFETPSGRVYARYVQPPGESITRALTLVQTFWVLHDIIQRDWLPIRYVSVHYAQDLVESEILLYSHTVNGITRELTQVCKDAGYNVDEGLIDRVVYEICSKYAGRSRDVASVSAASSSCVDSATNTPSSCGSSLPTGSHTSRLVCIPTKAPADTLCASRDNSIQFIPSMVHWHGLVEYLVVHAVSEYVSVSIDRGWGRGVVSDIDLRNDEILASVETELTKLVTSEACADMKHVLRQLANRDSLRQCIPAIIKSLLNEGKNACAAANASGCVQFVAWSAKYEPDRIKRGMVLTVGYGAHDPMAFLFFNLCSRIKGWLDQSWPLPVGVEWKVKRPRVSVAVVTQTLPTTAKGAAQIDAHIDVRDATGLNHSPSSCSSAPTASPRL